MSAVDEIQAAIVKLTELKESPKPPYFDRWNDEDFTYGNLDDAVEEGFDFGEAYGKWHEAHRTIDAQLAILADFADRYALRTKSDWVPIAPAASNALALARAINGTA